LIIGRDLVAVALQNPYLKLVHLSISMPCMIKSIAKVVPVLNGRDSDGKPKYLGPEATKIHRYLLVLCVAKSEPVLRSFGKEIHNSIYFTLYRLWQVANSFKDVPPYHLPITFDRTKVAIKVYNMMSEKGLVIIKNMEGTTYLTITKKGEDLSEQFLQDVNTYANTYFDTKYGYLIVLWVAKTTPIFRSFGKEIDDSIYFTLYGLGKVADSFKQIRPYHIPVYYDRIKAVKIYTMMSNTGLVVIKKIGGNIYVTTTKKGDDVSKNIAGSYGTYR
jgi:predicted transcriptional regulator